MAGPEDKVAKSHDRWATAEHHSRGVTDNGLSAALHTYYTRYFPAGVFIIMALTITGGYLLAGGGPVHWQRTLSLGAILVGFAGLVGGTIYERERLAPSAHLGSASNLLSLLEEEEGKALMRGINGKGTIEAEHLTVARAVAVQQRKKTASTLLGTPCFCFLFSSVGTPAGWFAVALVPAVLIITAVFIRDFRRQGRFLAITAE